MTSDQLAATQAFASLGALVVAFIALGIAWQARSAEAAQAATASKALATSRRQMALSLVPFLRVDHPAAVWDVDYPYLEVGYQNGGPGVA